MQSCPAGQRIGMDEAARGCDQAQRSSALHDALSWMLPQGSGVMQMPDGQVAPSGQLWPRAIQEQPFSVSARQSPALSCEEQRSFTTAATTWVVVELDPPQPVRTAIVSPQTTTESMRLTEFMMFS